MIHLNEAGIQTTAFPLKRRLKLLWRVFCYVFNPWTYYGVHHEIDEFGRIVVSGWIKKPSDVDYKYHYVAYDGETIPSAYVDGRLIETKNTSELKLIGKVLDREQ